MTGGASSSGGTGHPAPAGSAATGEPAIAGACRNCGAPAPGAFCPVCGQETRLALPTARQFLREAAGRYVALDGRLWRTLFALLLRPGFLTREYLAGRRRRYIRPARLFLVLSIALFAVLRFVADAPVFVGAPEVGGKATEATVQDGLDLRFDDQMNLHLDGVAGSLGEPIRKRIEHFNRLSPEAKAEQMFLGTLRFGPYALFALLPAFAWLLQVAYVGRRRRYPGRPHRYAEHLVFGAHNHAFLCLALILATAPVGPLRTALALWIGAYFLWSMKAVYGGRWSGIFARALALAVAYAVLFAVVTAGLLFVAVLLR